MYIFMVVVYMRSIFARDQDSEGIARPGFRRDSATKIQNGWRPGKGPGFRMDGVRGRDRGRGEDSESDSATGEGAGEEIGRAHV